MNKKCKQAILNLVVVASMAASCYAKETNGVRNGDEVLDSVLHLKYTINTPNNTLTVSGTDWQSNAWVGDFEIPEAVVVDSIRMPVTAIGNYAFHSDGTDNQISGHLTIPDSVTQIGVLAFYNNMMTGISLPNSITSIGGYAFQGCFNLTSIRIPSLVKVIQEYTFYECTSLSEVDFSNQLTTINDNAFAGCSSLTSLVFPATLSKIDFYAFSICFNLKSIEFKGNPPETYSNYFDNGDNPSQIYVICKPNIGFEQVFSERSNFRIQYSTPYAVFEKSSGASISNGSRLNFGTALTRSKGKIVSVRLKNTGNKTLNLGKPSLKGAQRSSFEIVSMVPTSIAPGKAINVKIRFKPIAATSLKSTLSIRCNDPTKKTLQLHLVGKGF